MVNCSYCKKEMPREVFCSNSHRVLFGRNRALVDPKRREREVDAIVVRLLKDKPLVDKVVANKPVSIEDVERIVPKFRKKSCPKHKIFSCGCKE